MAGMNVTFISAIPSSTCYLVNLIWLSFLLASVLLCGSAMGGFLMEPWYLLRGPCMVVIQVVPCIWVLYSCKRMSEHRKGLMGGLDVCSHWYVAWWKVDVGLAVRIHLYRCASAAFGDSRLVSTVISANDTPKTNQNSHKGLGLVQLTN